MSIKSGCDLKFWLNIANILGLGASLAGASGVAHAQQPTKRAAESYLAAREDYQTVFGEQSAGSRYREDKTRVSLIQRLYGDEHPLLKNDHYRSRIQQAKTAAEKMRLGNGQLQTGVKPNQRGNSNPDASQASESPQTVGPAAAQAMSNEEKQARKYFAQFKSVELVLSLKEHSAIFDLDHRNAPVTVFRLGHSFSDAAGPKPTLKSQGAQSIKSSIPVCEINTNYFINLGCAQKVVGSQLENLPREGKNKHSGLGWISVPRVHTSKNFYITLGDIPSWDASSNVVAKLKKDQGLIAALKKLKRGVGGVPTTPVNLDLQLILK